LPSPRLSLPALRRSIRVRRSRRWQRSGTWQRRGGLGRAPARAVSRRSRVACAAGC